MGIPAVQLFLIFARQMAKPVSNGIMNYGRKHPFFRNRVLIPAGRGIANFMTRVRMRDLGLGKPATLVQISDEAALSQASDILQEAVIYLYGIGMFSLYYYYSKKHEKDVVTADELQEIIAKFEERMEMLQKEIDVLRRKEQPAIDGRTSTETKTTDTTPNVRTLPSQKSLFSARERDVRPRLTSSAASI